MRAASEQRLVHARFAEQASHRFEMDGVAAMGRARDRKLRLAEREGVRGAALDERHRLERLDGGAGKHRTLDSPSASSTRPSVSATATAPRWTLSISAPRDHLDKDRIVVSHLTAGVTTGARRAPHRPGAESKWSGARLVCKQCSGPAGSRPQPVTM